MNTFIKGKDNKVYLNNELVGNLVDVINTMIENKDKKYYFKNFNKEEIKGIKLIVKRYNEYITENNKKEQMTIATHSLKYKMKKYKAFNSSLLDIFRKFKEVDEIEFKRIGYRDIIIIQGIVCLYGIKNEYGFYDIDDDDFIPIEELEDNPSILIEELKEEKKLHYVRKRVR